MFFRRAASVLFTLCLAVPATAQQTPSRVEIRTFIEQEMSGAGRLRAFDLGFVDFKAFGGASGKGWISLAGSMVLQEPMFRKSDQTDLAQALMDRGIPQAKVQAMIAATAKARGTNKPPEEYALAVPVGYRVGFQSQLRFAKTSRGFDLAGQIDPDLPAGKLRGALPAAALITSSSAFEEFTQTAVTLYRRNEQATDTREQAIKTRQTEINRFWANQSFQGMVRSDAGWTPMYSMKCGTPTGWRFVDTPLERGFWSHVDCSILFETKGRIAGTAFQSGDRNPVRMFSHVFYDGNTLKTRAMTAPLIGGRYVKSNAWMPWSGQEFGQARFRVIKAQARKAADATLTAEDFFARYRGDYTGQVNWPGRGTYTASVSINNFIGSATYPELNCGGRWNYVQLPKGATHFFLETLTSGAGNCIDGAYVGITPRSDGSIVYALHRMAGGQPVAEGILTRR